MNTMRVALNVESGSTGMEGGSTGINALWLLFGADSASTGMKTLRLLSTLVLLAGVCLTGRALYLHAKAFEFDGTGHTPAYLFILLISLSRS
jgi:hypothetical protein